MTRTLQLPDIRRILDDLGRRIGILERRITPVVADASRHTHDGTGSESTIVTHSADNGASSPGTRSVAIGDDASGIGYASIALGWAATAEGMQSICLGNALAYDDYDIAIGQGAQASDGSGVAVGYLAHADGPEATAIGASAQADYAWSTAVGIGAHTTAEEQVMLGNAGTRTVQGCPEGAIPDANLSAQQMSFYLNEASNLLVVKVKYSTGTVKTGTIALT